MDITSSLQGFGSFAIYLAAAIAAEVVFVILYMAVTPHREVTLIKAGNAAAAVSLGGAVLGFTLPLASAIAHSVSLLDMAVWSAVALGAQLALFLLAAVVLRALSRHIEDGNLAAGIMLATASITLGLLNAACMTY
jgi:putative membrane protein